MVKHLRYTASVNGIHRKILSIDLQSSGDLIIDLKLAPKHRSRGDSATIDGQIEWARMSVHPSKKSTTGNQITRTTNLIAGERTRYVQFTRAIKTTNRWAPLIFRMYPNLNSDEIQQSNLGEDAVSLGDLDTSRFTLVTGLYVGSASKNFTMSLDDDMIMYPNIHKTMIGDYKILLMYQFLELASIDHGATTFLWTDNPDNVESEKVKREINWIMDGVDDYNAAELFLNQRHTFQVNRYYYLQSGNSNWGEWSRIGTLSK